eukprot:scaffold266_cov391-Prasinococcus_capsulatus_cf.AAC.30
MQFAGSQDHFAPAIAVDPKVNAKEHATWSPYDNNGGIPSRRCTRATPPVQLSDGSRLPELASQLLAKTTVLLQQILV